MTNKTIIDGIDVSKCSEYDEEQFFECEISCCHCEELPNCYFKQLARAKEELEKWKHQAELGSDTTDRLSKQLEQKEQECEELKIELEQQKALTETYNVCYRAKHNDIDGKLFKYKQALENIEHILETYTDDDWKATREIENIINKVKDGE